MLTIAFGIIFILCGPVLKLLKFFNVCIYGLDVLFVNNFYV